MWAEKGTICLLFEYGNELQKIKNPSLITELGLLSDDCGGRRGIRTLDTEKPYNGFRVRRIRPLCHPSALSRAKHYNEIHKL